MQPCKMLHPILGIFDKDRTKSIFSCERIVEQVYDTTTFKVALREGYKLVKVHRLHKYKKKESLWKPILTDLYTSKMKFSRDEPEDLAKLARKYGRKFGEDFEEKILATRGSWGYNKAKRTISKNNCNCGWGKHCQRPVMDEVVFIESGDREKMHELFQNFHQGVYNIKNCSVFENHAVYNYEQSNKVQPDLHSLAMAASSEVPALARLYLWREMDKIERTQVDGRKRVVMCDTDSIVYIYYPEDKYDDVYNVEEGKLLGDWEREDDDKSHE